MPYRTKYGSHYHETYGCHGATEPCSTEGLSPCSDCCGDRANGGSPSSGSPSSTGASAGSPATGTASDIFAPDGTTASSTGAQGAPDMEGRDERRTTVSGIRQEAAEDYVMELADTLLSIKRDMDAARDGQMSPEENLASMMESPALRAVLESLPDPSLATRPAPEEDISPDDLVGEPMTPEQAFRRQREEAFMEDFRAKTAEAIRKWDRDDWDRWREANEGLAEYMKGNLRRERPPELSRFIDEEVESLLRRRYEEEVPCPNWGLASQWQRYGRLLTGGEERWPGYEDAKRAWDAESDLLWQAQSQARRSAARATTRRDARKRDAAVA